MIIRLIGHVRHVPRRRILLSLDPLIFLRTRSPEEKREAVKLCLRRELDGILSVKSIGSKAKENFTS